MANKANGATLAAVSGGYLYTAPDGTKITFVDLSGGDQGYTNFCGSLAPNQSICSMMPSTITSPDGRVTTLTYQYYTYPGPPYGSQPTTTYSTRLKSISNTFQYSITIGYSTIGNGHGSSPPPAGWNQRLSAKFYNNSISTTTPQASLTYAYPAGDTTDITDFAGQVWEVTSTSIKRPGETSPSFTVGGSSGAVTSVTADGVTTGYAYTVSGTTATMVVTDALSNHTTVVSDLSTYRPTSITNALGKTVTNTYDSYGRLTQVTQPEGNYISYTLDARGNATIIKVGGKTGHATPALTTNAAYDTTCSNPLTCNQPNSVTTPLSSTTNYTYDPTSGQVATVTLPAPTAGANRPQKRYTYTATGGIYLLTGASECQTGTAPACVGTADEVKTAIGYDANGNAISVSRGAGNGSLTATASATYTAMGDLLTVDGPLAGTADTTTYRYDAARRQLGVIYPDPDGAGPLNQRAVRTTYDTAGRVTETELGTVTGTTDPAWAVFSSVQQQTTAYVNNLPSNQVLTASGTTYGVTQYSYDADGRSDCVATRMNSATWGTLTPACTLQTTGSFGSDRITRTAYDAVGRINKVTTAYGTADQSDDATATFSDNGRTATLLDANGNKTTYIYDRFDRLVQTQYPSPTMPGTSSTTDYDGLVYDNDNRVTSRQLRGYAGDSTQHIDYTYDNDDRVTLKTLPGGGLAVTYGYDELNRLTSSATSAQTVSFTYDALGRNLTQAGPLGTLTSQFDLAGRRTRLTWPDTFYVTYDYDVTGNMTVVHENGATSGVGLLATFGYDSLGRRITLARGNGSTTTYTPDPVSRLSTLAHDLAGTANDLTLGFNYNPANQISTTTRSNDLYAWRGAYNVNRAYTVNGLNQVTTSGAATLVFDAKGNLQSDGINTYSYDAENRLTATVGANSGNLAYDPLGRLKTTSGGNSGTTNYLYDGDALVAEYGTSSNLLRRYVHGQDLDTPLVWYEGAGTTDRRFLHADERGSIVATSDSAGNKLSINSYDEFGIPGTGNSGRFGYTGQIWLSDQGMYYYKARVYSPMLGRFLQTDPVGYASGVNLYAYVLGDPINFTDPAGLDAKCGGGSHYTPPSSAEKAQAEAEFERTGVIVVDAGHCDPDSSPTNGSPAGGGGGSGKPSPPPVGPQNNQPQMCPAAYTPNGDTKGENPQAQGDRYNTDLPGGYEAALATFEGLTRLDAIQNGGDGGFHLDFDPRRPTTVYRSNSGNIGLRYAFSNGRLVFRVDINPNTFSLNKAETIHFNGSGRGNMCPTR